MINKFKKKYLFVLIIIIAIFLRFYDLNWDQNTHIHPDERFLTMVGNAMRVPQSFSDYLNPNISLFNPANIGNKFFVYGLFPLILNKLLAIALSNDTYNGFTIQGRFLSALADLFVVLLIFKTGYILERKYKFNPKIKFFSSFLYSIFVLPIQLSHFFAVDTFLNLFCFTAFYFTLSYWIKRKSLYLYFAAIFFGFAFASKITAIFSLLLIIPFLLIGIYENRLRNFLNFLIFIFVSYLSSRIAYPYIFATSNLFNFNISPLFIENLQTLNNISSKASFFPPNVQWINKIPILFPLQNLVVFGIGIPAFAAFLIGAIKATKTRAKIILSGILLWIAATFLIQGIQTSTPMRYFIILYPFIAIIGGVGLANLKWKRVFIVLTIFIISAWTLMFLSVYTKPHSRVTASYWILQNIPTGKVVLSEHWDDALPLFEGGNYQILQLPVFDPDTQQKWQTINGLLQKGDYLILSSNRGWGSIPTVPERYPRMTKFYKDLFDNKLEFKKIKEFTSYPSLSYFGLPINFPDQWADESFTVYDHPKVMIFKKMK